MTKVDAAAGAGQESQELVERLRHLSNGRMATETPTWNLWACDVLPLLRAAAESLEANARRAQTVRELLTTWREYADREFADANSQAERAYDRCANELEAALSEQEPKP